MKKYFVTHHKEEISFEIDDQNPGSLQLVWGDQKLDLNFVKTGSNHYSVLHEGKSYNLRFFHDKENTTAFLDGEPLYFEMEDERARARKKAAQAASGGVQGRVELKSMMPGKIVRVSVNKGDEVKEGQGVVVVEAMKMENEMASPKNGTVTDVRVTAGQSVESGALLVVIE